MRDPELTRLSELVESVGGTNVQITMAKLYPSHPQESRHVRGHHVGSWHFVVPRMRMSS